MDNTKRKRRRVATFDILTTAPHLDEEDEQADDQDQQEQAKDHHNHETDDDTIILGGIFDRGYWFGEELFNFTIHALNDPTDGLFDDLYPAGSPRIEYLLSESDCGGERAANAYWDLRTRLGGTPPMGIVGPRCTDDAIMLATVAGLENVAVTSPSSSGRTLSNNQLFPLFNRMVAPDDQRGQLGAIFAVLEYFGWNRVCIITTDTAFAQGLLSQFTALYKGQITYSGTIGLTLDGTLDERAVQAALRQAPSNDPRVNSRVYLFLGDHLHAFDFLKAAKATAEETKFNQETIWVGPGAWAGRQPQDFTRNDYQVGYIGITPFWNRDQYYQHFLARLQQHQRQQGREPWETLPDAFAPAQMVDAIVAMAMAISRVPPQDRHNGTTISAALRTLTFDGVSGPVAFTPEGDRRDPLYSVIQSQPLLSGDNDGNNHNNNNLTFKLVGRTGIHVNSTQFYSDATLCAPTLGCGLDPSQMPPAEYPVPFDPYYVKIIASIVVPLAFFSLILVVYVKWKAWRDKNRLQLIQTDLERLRQEYDEYIEQRVAIQEAPPNWDPWDDEHDDRVLFEVLPMSKDGSVCEEFWTVSDALRGSMPDAHISHLWRVQSRPLWAAFQAKMEQFDLIGLPLTVEKVFHGTGTVDPSLVYLDTQFGFDVRFNNGGLWGPGSYFAGNSKYSFDFAFQPGRQGPWYAALTDRPGALEDDHEMFLADLLVGHAIELQPDRELRHPPYRPEGGMYNTVIGEASGSPIFIVYENGRSYPTYLIRFYRGAIDRFRTPYDNRDEVERAASRAASARDYPGATTDEQQDRTLGQVADIEAAYRNEMVVENETKNAKRGRESKLAEDDPTICHTESERPEAAASLPHIISEEDGELDLPVHGLEPVQVASSNSDIETAATQETEMDGVYNAEDWLVAKAFDNDHDDNDDDDFVWEFRKGGDSDDSDAWARFGTEYQGRLEAKYREYCLGVDSDPTIQITSAFWHYSVNVDTMKQTNLDVQTVRDIRRRAL